MARERKLAVLYAAKSSPDEKGSIDDQLKKTREWALANGYEIVGEYKDENASAYKGDRGKDLAEALEHAEQAGATLIVLHSDRLARGDAKRARHLVEIALWAIKADVKIYCLEDPTTFENLLMAVVMGDRNMEDSRRKAASVKAGLERRRKRGLFTGAAPFGFTYRRDEDDKRILVIFEERARWVRHIFARYLAGWGYPKIVRELEANGVLTATGQSLWNPVTVRCMLMTPVYAGLLRDGEELIEATHEAIVDRETWEKAQALHRAKAKTHKRGRPSAGKHLFRKGFLKCGICGKAMSPRTERDRPGRGRQTYYCSGRSLHPHTCDLKPIARAKVDDAVFAYFKDLGLDLETTKEQLASARERELDGARDVLASAERKALAARERLERVKRDYLSGELNAAEWRELKAELEPEVLTAETETERLRKGLQEAESESALSQVTAELLGQLSEIRAEIAKEVTDAEGAAAARAALMRLFDGFVLRRGSPRHQKREITKVGYWLEPVLSQDQMGGYVDRLRTKVRQTDSGFPNGKAKKNSDPLMPAQLEGCFVPAALPPIRPR